MGDLEPMCVSQTGVLLSDAERVLCSGGSTSWIISAVSAPQDISEPTTKAPSPVTFSQEGSKMIVDACEYRGSHRVRFYAIPEKQGASSMQADRTEKRMEF